MAAKWNLEAFGSGTETAPAAEREGDLRVLEWLVDYSEEKQHWPGNYRYELQQYRGGRWVKVPVVHRDAEGNVLPGRLSGVDDDI